MLRPNELRTRRAARLITRHPRTALFVTSLLRAREIKMAAALRGIGWKVVLIYLQTTPFNPDEDFDVAIRAESAEQALAYAKAMWPRICHVFSGAVDPLVELFCRDKPGPVVADFNDVFCPSLFDYCHERFEPTRACFAQATALCARDLQPKAAQRLDGYVLPRYRLLFPEFTAGPGPTAAQLAARSSTDEIHVVSVGTFCLETHGMYDSCYLQLARTLTAQQIHLHIYPHWFYRQDRRSVFNWNLRKDFADFFALENETGYLHVHESLDLPELARELPQYDFGIVSGASANFGQRLQILKPAYMASCYSGRISDYLDARLPVLINPEVRFNYWLLERLGVGINLDGLLRPGFRDELLRLKRDRALAERVERAATRYSLARQVERLGAFYDAIIADHPQSRAAAGRRIGLARRLPGLSRPLDTIENEARQLPLTQAQLGFAKRDLARMQAHLGTIRDELVQEEHRHAVLSDDFAAHRARHADQIEASRSVIAQLKRELDALRRHSAEEVRTARDQCINTEQMLGAVREELAAARSDAAHVRAEMAAETAALRDQTRQLTERLDNVRSSLAEKVDAFERRSRFARKLLWRLHARDGYSNVEDVKLRLEADRGPNWSGDVAGMLNWPQIEGSVERNNGMPELLEMMRLFASGSTPLNHVSSCWDLLNFKNFNQLLAEGYRNFKRTLGCNYFNFLIQAGDPQIAFLESALGTARAAACRREAESLPDDRSFDWHDQLSYRYFVLLLWHYALDYDSHGALKKLEEPTEGNPLMVPADGHPVSQDLANSALEYISMAECVIFPEIRRVLEIGGGYGRDAFVVLQLHPGIQYTLVDVPPAIWVAQRYLSSVFRDRRVFHVRHFASYDEVREEMEQSDIVFLLPHQLGMIPEQHFDLSLNVSSFGEMTRQQIESYFHLLERVTRGHFYMKQWKTSHNVFDRISLSEADYPVSPRWERLYSRPSRVQTDFFETMYRAVEGKS